MSLTSRTLIPHSSLTRISFKLTPTDLQTPNLDVTVHSHFKTLKSRMLIPFKSHPKIRAFDSDVVVDKQYIVADDTFSLDDFLSAAEFFCLASSAVISIGYVINSTFSTSQKPVLEWFGNRVSVWQSLLLAIGIVIGVVIRRRQWRRVCFGFSKPGASGINLVERIEKVEEDLRTSATIIRVLSRQLEKLGIRFRVTRKSMKEPIAQTAELAKKNSEATRALALQEDNLEKELAEIQKVLLAMQSPGRDRIAVAIRCTQPYAALCARGCFPWLESVTSRSQSYYLTSCSNGHPLFDKIYEDQQQKQLELILAIAKSGKLLDNKPAPSQDEKKSQTTNFAAGVTNSDGTR